MALVVSAMHGYLGTAIQNVKLLLCHWRVAGIEAVPAITLEHSWGPEAGVRVSDFDGDGGDDMAAMNLYRRLACDKGAELIEFALVFPLLLLVMVGIMDFGLLFQRYETVTNAAREGARIAVLPGYAQADVAGPRHAVSRRQQGSRRRRPSPIPPTGAESSVAPA